MNPRLLAAFLIVSCAAVASACSGGGGGGGYGGGSTTTPTAAPTTSLQVVRLALPTSSMGYVTDPTFGRVGGYTQTNYSQVLGFAPGAQIMIQNDDSTTVHTFGDTGGHGSFPTSGSGLSTTAAGGSTVSSGFQTGTLNIGQLAGPFTLTAGTYYIGCAYHYASNSMRDVLVVSAGAAPGPAATQNPGLSSTPPPYGGGGGYY